ncbi:HypC/HybG/HupF family hydrogenase formation chaperone [Azotobacter vinelandii]|uniref:HypC/HybG/HupF family hydrogenase formation chaperone n=1 Tax=Azotobacter vinelandii TaxID=354 RepID=UPI00077458AE|nr:HypC/HybG/HupF family hydrogenase formation chaperone [Azotobacter vinelandii]WKN21880.1 HypC/HybG/HupF family hydrogenase formation chaperone [Azotobacter vinelandii]
MCLAIPVRIEELLDEQSAVACIGGLRKTINVALLDDLKVGDYVILHVGFALQKLNEAEAQRTLALLAELGRLAEAEQAAQGEAP